MKTLNAIALSCFLSCTLAGCDDGGKETPAPVEPAPPSPEGQTPPEHEHPAGEGVVAAGAAAGPVAAACPQGKRGAGVTGGAQSKVTPGTYCVCNSGSAKHGHLKADHLVVNEAVVIPAFVKDGQETLNWVTTVQLGATAVQMTRSADETQLNALVRYTHKDVNTQADEDAVHSVSITPYKPGPEGQMPTGCDASKNVLTITFCAADESGEWPCESRPGFHGGDTYVQN